MTEYDNTNSGAGFKKYDDQILILQGEVDVEGDSRRFVIVKQPVSRNGEPVLVMYEKVGVLFPNDKKGNDKAPDYSGPYEGRSSVQLRLAAWKKFTEKAGNFLSLKLSEKQQNGERQALGGNEHKGVTLDDDEIPF